MSKTKNIFQIICFILIFLTVATALIILSFYLSEHSAPRSTANDLESTPDSRASLPLVVIDAGHGGEDGGAIGANGIYEKHINFEISMKLYELLKCSNIPVVLTRDKDILLYDTSTNYVGRKKALDLAKRLEIAKSYENSVFISIHQNSFSDSKYYGLQVYYSKNNDDSLLLAETIQATAKEYLQNENTRNVKGADKNIFLLHQLTSPAVLIECGFLSNPEECELLSTEEYQLKMATVIYLSVVEYFENSEN